MGLLDFQTTQEFEDAEYSTTALEDSAGLWFIVLLPFTVL